VKEGGWFVNHSPGEGTYINKDVQWASFNDVRDIQQKATWIKANGLGGASVFTLDNDDSENVCGCGPFPLLNEINRALGRSPSNDSIEDCSLEDANAVLN
jgi:hypothetical protein